MKREDLLAKGYTEEQVTDILNTFHGISKENEKLKGELIEKADIETKFNEANAKLEEINKASMTEQEKFEAMKKEAETNLKQSRILLNKTKAQNILVGLDIDDELLSSLVSDDEKTTLDNATRLKTKFETYKDNIIKETKNNIASLNAKPSATNIPQDDGSMTFDKFRTLSQAEQNAFAKEHPEEFAKL